MHSIEGDLIKEKILSVLNGGSILFIVPPFSRSCKGALLDPHTLQALAAKKGYKADILYLNILLASIISVNLYEKVSNSPRFWMLGERLFARSAYGLPPLGISPELCWDEAMCTSGNQQHHVKMFYETENLFHQPSYLKLEDICYSFIEEVMQVIASLHYKMTWCTIGWEQTNCAAAIFKRIKKSCPDTVTLIGGLMGGMNCEDQMAEGIASLSDTIDYIFSGEIECAFDDFLETYSTGQLPSQKIIFGEPVTDLDALPLPDYESFFSQVECFLKNDPPGKLVVSYETSRGCWKGQNQRCAFCGLNSEERIKYRYKKAEKVAGELEEIGRRYPNTIIFMTDHILPSTYYRDLLPIFKPPEEFSIRYELLANLKLKDLVHLKSSRVNRIQPGIEALSTNLLDLIHKGITAHQNILVMRNALSVGIFVYWYLLWGFPGDKAADYEETLRILPLLRHLQPPAFFSHIRLERFSMYVENPGKYRIDNLRPWAAYKMIYPEWADVDKLAYRFIGEYPSESHDRPDLMEEIAREVETWQRSWREANLTMTPSGDYYIILDSRKIGVKNSKHILEYPRANELMRYGPYQRSEHQDWALEQKLAVVVDDWYVPLVTASPELLLQFES